MHNVCAECRRQCVANLFDSRVKVLNDVSRLISGRTDLFATYCRLNILYRVARAGSGHPGTCLSSIDLMSWLYLNEIRRLPSVQDQVERLRASFLIAKR